MWWLLLAAICLVVGNVFGLVLVMHDVYPITISVVCVIIDIIMLALINVWEKRR